MDSCSESTPLSHQSAELCTYIECSINRRHSNRRLLPYEVTNLEYTFPKCLLCSSVHVLNVPSVHLSERQISVISNFSTNNSHFEIMSPDVLCSTVTSTRIVSDVMQSERHDSLSPLPHQYAVLFTFIEC